MKTIDGSLGEGGGQILRTSLALAAITGTEVHFEKIRANRAKPGLMRQHLMCVKAVTEICGGEAIGAELCSTDVVFRPGHINGGEYRFAIGSAGSVLLLAQAILPVLLFADVPSKVILEGGTYNTTESPCFDFFERVFVPCLRKQGIEIGVSMKRVGFCPAGGGIVELFVEPARIWREFSLCERGELQSARVTALGSGLEQSILLDELRMFQDGLADMLSFQPEARMVESAGSGNALIASLEFENLTELFCMSGSFGTSRKTVARRVAEQTRQYLECGWVVGRYLADQLLLPMSLGAGGRFITGAPTLHSSTNREIIQKFLDVEINFNKKDKDLYEMEVKK